MPSTLEAKIASCFEEIPRDGLERELEARISDQSTLKLLRGLLRVGVMDGGSGEHREAGTPQGGVISPLLANVYLHQVDAAWATRGVGVLVRYADDLIVMCRSREEAERALVLLRELVGSIGLRLKESKTRFVHLREGDGGFNFLGYHHKWVRGGRKGNITYLARLIAKRHSRCPRWGRKQVFCLVLDQLGVMSVRGIVVPPHPFQPWRSGTERRR